MASTVAVLPTVITRRGAAGYRVSRLSELAGLTAGTETMQSFTAGRTYYLPPTGSGAVIVTGAGKAGGPAPILVRISRGVYREDGGPGSLPTYQPGVNDVNPDMYGWGPVYLLMVPAYIPISGPADEILVGLTPLLHPNWIGPPGGIYVNVALVTETVNKDGYPIVEVPQL